GFDNTVSCEWFFIFDAPYSDPLPDPEMTVDIQSIRTPMMWFGLPMRCGNVVTPTDQFQITANHTNGPGNAFVFSTIAPTIGDPAIARADVTRINVFPNPYQSFDRGDPTRFTQFVTFTHLPQRAIVRIYTLAGIMVKSMLKDDPAQFLQWDMKNESGRPVAAGMYLVHIQMPDLGSTKTLKLGILAEKQ
ncbi:MAG TPA: T9SS type A sorting domain-containing protein, partial [Bacteroidota bacterium]|nr:T9SS type A sorting domain-containing protein [Bacteroidota bacterium]